MQILEHPYLRPIWVKVVIVFVTGLWAMFEFANGALYWGILFLAICITALLAFFVVGPDDDEVSSDN